MTTSAPVVTEAPVVTTSAPVVTEAPIVTSSAPVATEAPVVTTSAPVVTEAPVVTTSAPVAVLTNAVEDKVVTPETNAEATESRVLATPLAAKAEQAQDKEAKDAKDPSPAPVAQATPAGEDELPNTGTSMGTLYLILSAVFLTGGAFVFAKSKK